MKKRYGFVSNSSSSIFVCDVTGDEQSGWDLGLSDLDWYECVGGHIIGVDLKKSPYDLSKEEVLNYVDFSDKYMQEYKIDIEKMTDEEWEENGYDFISDYLEIRYNLPEELCPICSMKVLGYQDYVQYLTKFSGISKDEVFKVVKEKKKRRRKLYDSEYIDFVTAKKPEFHRMTIESTLKEKFKSYDEFHSFLWG